MNPVDDKQQTGVLSYIEQHLGLSFSPSRQAELAAVLGELLRLENGRSGRLDATAFALGRVSDEVLQALVQRITVGETYFFRERGTLEALEKHILPSLIERRAGGTRHLRLWSAGCCTGEEPLTLAILLERLLPDIDSWKILILATDINTEFLRRAEEGVYTEWSFRGIDAEFRSRFFDQLEPHRFRVHPRILSRVKYMQLNLADNSYPGTKSGIEDMDLILCRNVLMYFSPRQAQAALRRMYHTLAPGGWLSMSPTEYMLQRLTGFAPRNFNGVSIYQKQEQAAPQAGAPAGLGILEPRIVAPALASLPGSVQTTLPAPIVPLTVPAALKPVDPLSASKTLSARCALQAREAADAGRLTDALDLCREAIAADRINPALHFLRARVLEEIGRPEDAAVALGRVLYLDPEFIPAHFALGSLALRQDKKPQAAKCFQRALNLLRPMVPETVLPEMEGLTAGHLRDMIYTLQHAA
ncbi:MAG: CheR family methyltransferase [Candidatus Methylacidiphilales bacterium]|nr:CheR family methyltransferase [Candidatus Methylacidiphilales bacterium]